MRVSAAFHKLTVLVFILTVSIMIWPTSARADRQGYSVLGAGVSLVDYEESSTLSVAGGAIDIETDTAAIVTQSSGTFVSINPAWGFYLHTLSTLGVPDSKESWELDETVVRNNSVAFQFQRVELLGSRKLTNTAFHTLFGIQYTNFEYRRFGAELTAAAADFGIDENTFDAGTISETVWDVSALAGVERNTIFSDSGKGWRSQARVLLGVPLISSIVNTSVANGKSFSENFNGVELRALGIIGYQFSQHFFIGTSLEATYVRKNSVDRNSSASGNGTEFPATTFVSLFPGVGAYWSF